MRFYIAVQSQLLVAAVISVLATAALVVVLVLLIRLFKETREKTMFGDQEMVCQNCGSNAIRASYQSGILDAVFSLFSLVPFRCEVCYWRFYAYRPGEQHTAPMKTD